jgi:hypothetical protein
VTTKLEESKTDRSNLHCLIRDVYEEVKSAKKWLIYSLWTICGTLIACCAFLAYNGGFVTQEKFSIYMERSAKDLQQRDVERKELYQAFINALKGIETKVEGKEQKR